MDILKKLSKIEMFIISPSTTNETHPPTQLPLITILKDLQQQPQSITIPREEPLLVQQRLENGDEHVEKEEKAPYSRVIFIEAVCTEFLSLVSYTIANRIEALRILERMNNQLLVSSDELLIPTPMLNFSDFCHHPQPSSHSSSSSSSSSSPHPPSSSSSLTSHWPQDLFPSPLRPTPDINTESLPSIGGNQHTSDFTRIIPRSMLYPHSTTIDNNNMVDATLQLPNQNSSTIFQQPIIYQHSSIISQQPIIGQHSSIISQQHQDFINHHATIDPATSGVDHGRVKRRRKRTQKEMMEFYIGDSISSVRYGCPNTSLDEGHETTANQDSVSPMKNAHSSSSYISPTKSSSSSSSSPASASPNKRNSLSSNRRRKSLFRVDEKDEDNEEEESISSSSSSSSSLLYDNHISTNFIGQMLVMVPFSKLPPKVSQVFANR